MVANIANIIGGVLGSVGTLGLAKKQAEDSSALQYKYQSKLNKQNMKNNIKLINLQNAFNEAMMDKANAFNESMWNASVDLSNTAHQREVEDLRRAGLNPILSANGGATTVNPIQSAQTSSGNSQLSSSAGLPDVDYLSGMQTALGMYNSTRQLNSQLKNDATNRNSVEGHLNIDRNNSASQIALNDQKIEESKAEVKNRTSIAKATVKNLQAQAENAISSSARNYQDVKKAEAEIKSIENKIKYTTAGRYLHAGKLGKFGYEFLPNAPQTIPTLKSGTGHKKGTMRFPQRNR